MELPPQQFSLFEHRHRHARKQFDFFNSLNHPHFGLVAQVQVGPLLAFAKTSEHSLTRLIVHAIATAANAVPALRRRVREQQVVEHKYVHPSYAVNTDVSEGFSFCTVGFAPSFAAFAKTAQQVEARMRTDPSFADDHTRDDYLFLSAIPWVQFTGIQHAMGYHPTDSVPRISWGKIVTTSDGEGEMPLSIQAHHAVADGRALGAFYEAFAAYVTTCGSFTEQ